MLGPAERHAADLATATSFMRGLGMLGGQAGDANYKDWKKGAQVVDNASRGVGASP